MKMHIAMLLTFALIGTGSALAEDGFVLVSADEVAMDSMARKAPGPGGLSAGEAYDREVVQKVLDAPEIRILSPNLGGTLQAPIDIDVKFVPGPDAQIALHTLRIRYGLIGLDVTQRIINTGRVTKDGIRATGAILPPGKHTLSIQIADSAGRKANQRIQFTIEE